MPCKIILDDIRILADDVYRPGHHISVLGVVSDRRIDRDRVVIVQGDEFAGIRIHDREADFVLLQFLLLRRLRCIIRLRILDASDKERQLGALINDHEDERTVEVQIACNVGLLRHLTDCCGGSLGAGFVHVDERVVQHSAEIHIAGMPFAGFALIHFAEVCFAAVECLLHAELLQGTAEQLVTGIVVECELRHPDTDLILAAAVHEVPERIRIHHADVVGERHRLGFPRQNADKAVRAARIRLDKALCVFVGDVVFLRAGHHGDLLLGVGAEIGYIGALPCGFPLRIKCERIDQIGHSVRIHAFQHILNHVIGLVADPAVDLIHCAVGERRLEHIHIGVVILDGLQIVIADLQFLTVPDGICDVQLSLVTAREIGEVIVVVFVQILHGDAAAEQLFQFGSGFAVRAVACHRKHRCDRERRDQDIVMCGISERDLLHQFCGQVVLTLDECVVNGLVRDLLCGELIGQGVCLVALCAFLLAEHIAFFGDEFQNLADVRAVHIAVQIDVCIQASVVGHFRGCIRSGVSGNQHGVCDVHKAVHGRVTVACYLELRRGVCCADRCRCDAAARHHTDREHCCE